jgi:hypothetical protein
MIIKTLFIISKKQIPAILCTKPDNHKIPLNTSMIVTEIDMTIPILLLLSIRYKAIEYPTKEARANTNSVILIDHLQAFEVSDNIVAPSDSLYFF